MASRKPLVLGATGRAAELSDTDVLLAAAAQHTTLNVTNSSTVGSNTLAVKAEFGINAAAGQLKQLVFQTAGAVRWLFASNTDAETGGNAGANFTISRCTDAGVYIDSPVFINRASGVVTFTNVSVTGNRLSSIAAALTATGTTQATALVLTKDLSVVTTAAAGSGVIMSAPGIGAQMLVLNRGANALLVYPPVNGVIDALAANAAFSIPTLTAKRFIQATATQWYSV